MNEELPPRVAILVVDIEKFSGHTDVQCQQLAQMLPHVLAAAFDRCGLADVWADRKFPDPTGDGYIVGFAPARLPQVVDGFFDALQAELAERAKTLRGLGMRCRMRAGVTLGPIRELGDSGVHSPVDSTMIDNHRLIDTAAVRTLLTHADPDVTFVAVIMSAEVVEQSVIKGGYTRLRASQFVKVPVEIAAKDFAGSAYLRVPEPSGELLANGLLGAQPTPGEESTSERATPPASPAGVSIGDVRGVSGVVGSVGGSGHTIAGGAVTWRDDR